MKQWNRINMAAKASLFDHHGTAYVFRAESSSNNATKTPA